MNLAFGIVGWATITRPNEAAAFSAWAIMEFDGPRHRREDDEFRERELALPSPPL
ncbi:hypothetical protein IV102_38120 [bacterium]|nr:hypothetical protein [bacterium]